jgi:hypothetical protein
MNLKILKSKSQSTYKGDKEKKNNKHNNNDKKWELFVFDIDALMTNTSDINENKDKHDIKIMMNNEIIDSISSGYNNNVRINNHNHNGTDDRHDARGEATMVNKYNVPIMWCFYTCMKSGYVDIILMMICVYEW